MSELFVRIRKWNGDYSNDDELLIEVRRPKFKFFSTRTACTVVERNKRPVEEWYKEASRTGEKLLIKTMAKEKENKVLKTLLMQARRK